MAKLLKMKVHEKNEHKFSETYAKLIKFCKPQILSIVIAMICAIGGTLFILLCPGKLSEITNVITSGLATGIDFKAITMIACTLIIFCSANVILSFTQGFIMGTTTQKVANGLRKNISLKINKVPLSYYDTHQIGDTISRVVNDVDAIANTLNNSIVSFVSAIVQFVGAIIMMFITNWIMALVAILSSLLGFGMMSIIVSKSQKYFIENQNLTGKINGHIEEVYSAHNVVKAYNAENKLHNQFKTTNESLKRASKKAQFMSGLMMPLMGFVGNLGYLAICVAGALLVSSGTISIGVIVAFMLYVRLFTNPLNQIAQGMSSLQSCGAASFRVFEFLDQEELSDESKKTAFLNDAQGDLTFKNVRFGYNEERTIINNFSVNVKKGQKVAIVGPTGAGKTTMVNLLMRFYELNQPRLILQGELTNYKVFDNGKSLKFMINDENDLIINEQKTEIKLNAEIGNLLPKNETLKFDQDFNILNSNEQPIDYNVKIVTGNEIEQCDGFNFAIGYYGDILIDNVPTKSLTRENIHNLFCMVLQDTWLFNGTIKENIIFNKQGVSDEAVVKACKTAGVHHFITTLPEGYNTVLNEQASLSAGQKQLITIARAMVSDAPILILDEATSSVDTRTEELIQDAMDKLMYGRTTVVIAHRLSTIKNSDLILVMKDGDIIESGKHEQLLEKNGFYADLYNSQFEKIS